MKIPFKIRLLLWLVNRSKGTLITEMSPVEARSSATKAVKKLERFLDFPSIPLFKVFNHNAQGRDGIIPVRVYQPYKEKDLPIIMYFHGGGFVMRSIDSHDKVCRRIARDNGAIVISVEYGLAPENKFPKPVLDCYDATLWAVNNRTVHGGDVSRIIVMGDSAGGNLATAVCIMSRENDGPKLTGQVLIYPCTDATLSSPSIETCGNGYYLTKDMMIWFLNHYKSSDEDIYSPYLSMMLADDLSDLPPAFIFTAEYDPLKDEGRHYANRLRKAGNEVTFKEYGGMIHGFFSMPRMAKQSLRAYKDVQEQVTNMLERINS